jgi:large subunit ribosomal protein L14e
MINIGRVCVKIAGRDSGGKCVVVDVLDKNYVLVDGEVRRRKINITHIEPLELSVDIKKGTSHEDVMSALKQLESKSEKPKAKEKVKKETKAKKSKKK